MPEKKILRAFFFFFVLFSVPCVVGCSEYYWVHPQGFRLDVLLIGVCLNDKRKYRLWSTSLRKFAFTEGKTGFLESVKTA